MILFLLVILFLYLYGLYYSKRFEAWLNWAKLNDEKTYLSLKYDDNFRLPKGWP